MRSKWLGWAWMGLWFGCQVQSDMPPTPVSEVTAPLVGGELDEGDPGVVALTLGGGASCTGVLVSPMVVLTAAHCVDDLSADPSATVFFGSDVNLGGGRVPVAGRGFAPGWSLGENDIGTLLLDRPQSPALISPMNAAPATEMVGMDYRHVGFGVSVSGERGDSKKRQGTTTISSVEGDIIYSGDQNLAVCFGDSGGPAFVELDGVEKVVGIHSFTTSACGGVGGDTRVDRHLDSFILPYIQSNDETCGADGTCPGAGCTDDPDCASCGADGVCIVCAEEPDPDCPDTATGELCRHSEQCAEGSCVFWFEDLTTRFCTRSCTLGESCPTGMSCQDVPALGQICYYDDAPAGALGTACDVDLDCATAACIAGECATACSPVGMGCPVSFDCTTEDGASYYCIAEESGGCSTSSSGGPPGVLLGLIALIIGRGRRRHSR